MNVLLVCTGNTCRSPLAEAIARRLAAERRLDVEVRSAGTDAAEGDPASSEAVELAPELAAHRARRLTAADLAWADTVYAMEQRHADRVAELGGTAQVLVAAGVPDPLGLGPAAYAECAEKLERALREAL